MNGEREKNQIGYRIMYCIKASKTSYIPTRFGKSEEEETEEIIATFDTELMAKQFIDRCRLKQPIKSTWNSPINFKSNTLLGGYTYADIEIYEVDCIPHNPWT